ncbi:MAG: AarF/UbiB family protein, partial [Halobacteria archaeon]|nr:AarF/UbiB family protein [Halobacteria archaeon]
MASRLRVFLRFLKATWVLTPIALAHLRDRRRFLLFGKPRRVGLEKKRERAERLAEIFENMGVTYIKLAQFMTTRPDLVPPIYIDAMERLQDDVPPEDYEDIEPVIREEIGDPKEIFDWFEEESVSGASIAQVHMASYRGEKVAVKVRRPGLEETIDADLRVLSFFVPMIIWGLKFLDQNTHAESVKGITDELKKTIREEIDLKREGDVMSEVRQHLEEDGLTDDVVVPHVYHDLTTERILTMSYEDGIKVKYDEELRRRGHDLERIVDAIADAYLNMAFRYDVFHADPHQGNLAVNDKGQAVIYDFGIAQRPPEHIREAFTHFFIGV